VAGVGQGSGGVGAERVGEKDRITKAQ
jgi:hypothetical protein